MDSEQYIEQVLSHLPSELEDRDEIAMEIRSTIAERLADGEQLYQVLDQLGDPLELAESYLQDVPLERASFGRRLVAKVIDLVVPIVGLGVIVAIAVGTLSTTSAMDTVMQYGGLAVIGLMTLGIWTLVLIYPALAEWRYERTIGKQLMGLRVARESGARISLGQAFFRQLPWMLQVFWLDAFFALFTERHQRAAELLSHTRTVRVRS